MHSLVGFTTKPLGVAFVQPETISVTLKILGGTITLITCQSSSCPQMVCILNVTLYCAGLLNCTIGLREELFVFAKKVYPVEGLICQM